MFSLPFAITRIRESFPFRHISETAKTLTEIFIGVRLTGCTFFSKSKKWKTLAKFENPKPNVLERIAFEHVSGGIFTVADAYRGSKMKEMIDDYFAAATGNLLENVEINGTTLQIAGSADLIAFIGHNGLMDFKLDSVPKSKQTEEQDAIILACASRNYFSKHLRKTNAKPLLWTTNLMAPEAYILHDALEGWVANESDERVRDRGAAAYAKYQRISQKAADSLFVTGW